MEQIPDLLIEFIPVFGLILAAIVRWWQSRRTGVIAVPGEERERLGQSQNVSLSPDLVRRLEEEAGATVFAEVEKKIGHEPRLVPTAPNRVRVTRSGITFALVVLFSAAGFAWSIVTLSIHASSEAKYGATATIGWIFGYWFRPDLLSRRPS